MKNFRGCSLVLLPALAIAPAKSLFAEQMGVITVTGTREEILKSETPETSDRIDENVVDETRPAHPSELLERVPGVHINVTNGEGHITSIRQPMTTKAVYLYLEDGIPTRSTGFFNHNALYEVNIPQSAGVEITKGPGTALYGSDAIGGVINVLTRVPPQEAMGELSVEAGEFGWRRVLIDGGDAWEDGGIRGDLNLTHTDGWRDGTEYDRSSATVRWDRFLQGGASVKTVLATSSVDQQTAGTSRLSEDDYLNNPTLNYYPISYRDVKAVRLSSAYEKENKTTLLSLTPYVRHNYMDYMPNWSFSYDPSIQETESNSLGLLALYRMDFAPNRTRVIVGADIDYTSGSRFENSIDAFRNADGIYTSYTVEEVIYDYDVDYTALSPYVHIETSPWDDWRFSAGLRYDHFEYDYNNRIDDGQLVIVPPPASMSFPARYNHPSDTRVSFSHVSPKLGATYRFSDRLNGFVSYRHAFRAPSESQLFRPGSSAVSLDLDPVKADSTELGLRGDIGQHTQYELSVYHMRVRDDLVSYVDPVSGDRTTVNAGETLHRGVELGVDSRLAERLSLGLSYSYSKHTYEDWVQRVGSANVDYSGQEIESAPRVVSNVRLVYRPVMLNGGRAELEWRHLGKYWMDQQNTEKYDGHDLYHLRVNHRLDKQWNIYARVMNVTDERYATASSVSGGDREFAPGMPRTYYAGVDYSF